MSGAVEHKDVVLALVGAASGLSGLVLVFLGLVIGSYGGLAGDTPRPVRTRLRRTGMVVLVPFVLGVGSIACGTSWLLCGGSCGPLYILTVILFLGQLALLLLAALWTLKELLWD